MQLFAAQFHALDRWDTKAARVALHRSTHPDFRAMGEFIEEVTELIAPREAPTKEWPVYGVDNVNGVFFSHRQLGSNFRQKYKRIRNGWFFHNPTRSAVGSLGMVPEVPEDAITSPEYQVWRVTSGFIPEFLAIMIRTEAFKRLIRIHRVGAVKERLFVRNLKEITVPVPRELIQRGIVEKYLSTIAEIRRALACAADKAEDIDRCVLELLTFPAQLLKIQKQECSVFRWRLVERWDLPFYRSDFVDIQGWLNDGYKSRPLGELATFASEGWSAKDFPAGVFPYIEIGNIDRLHGIVDSQITPVTKAPSRAQCRVRRGDLLIATTRPYLGKFAIVPENFDGAVCSSGFSVIRGVHPALDREYLLFFLKSPLGLRQMERRMSGGSYPAITQDELEKVMIPVPEVSVQVQARDAARRLLKSAIDESIHARSLEEHVYDDCEQLILNGNPAVGN